MTDDLLLTKGMKKSPRKPLEMRFLLKQRAKLNKEIFEALKREYPLGSVVHWKHGVHEQRGRVVDHWEGYEDPMVQVENVNTGNKRRLTATSIIWYEDH